MLSPGAFAESLKHQVDTWTLMSWVEHPLCGQAGSADRRMLGRRNENHFRGGPEV